MKRIYAFTLDSDDYPSNKFRQNLRLIAYLLYDSVYNFGDIDSKRPLIINNSIKYNTIYEGGYGHNGGYYLRYDDYDERYINYEPLVLGEKSFALTVDDSLISEEDMCLLLEQNLGLMRVNYKYKINSIAYGSKDKDDEKNRKKSIYKLHDQIENNKCIQKVLVRKRVMNGLSSVGKKVGLL